MKKIQIVLILVICLAVLFTGCGNAGAPMANMMAGNGAPAPPMVATDSDVAFSMVVEEPLRLAFNMYGADGIREIAEDEYDGGYNHVGTTAEQRMIVTTASFSITADDFEEAMFDLSQMVRVSGGFIQQSESFAATETRGAFAHMTLRIPTQSYEGFRDFIMELGEVTFFSEGGEDVTIQFFDTEARLAVLREQETRIRSFIEHAQNLEEIFLIERELTRISIEIEQLTTVRDRLRNLTSYATIHLSISDGGFTPAVEAFGSRIDEAFGGSIDGFIALIQGLILLVIWIWPLLVIAAIIVFLVRRRRRRRKEANEFIQSQTQQSHQTTQTI